MNLPSADCYLRKRTGTFSCLLYMYETFQSVHVGEGGGGEPCSFLPLLRLNEDDIGLLETVFLHISGGYHS